MVMLAEATLKEVLAWLVRVSQIADKALVNLNAGNPYDAILLIKTVANADIRLLDVLSHFQNYDSHVKPYHTELVNECRAVLTLSKEALQEVSPELLRLSAEERAKSAAIFQSLFVELDKELNVEKEVAYWLSRAREDLLSKEKALTYSRLDLERATDSLNILVQDEKAMMQTAERFLRISKSIKHPNIKQVVNDLVKKRLAVKAVVEFVLKNAFKNGFTFKFGRDWYSDLAKISDLPSENIKELEAMRVQLASLTIFAKRNVNYRKISQLLARLISLSQHAAKVERAIELGEKAAKELGKTDDEILKNHWEARLRHGFVYHGTSSIFLQNMERFGLSSEQIFSEGTPFKPEDYTFFLRILKKAYGADEPFLRYFTQDVTQGFFLDANYNFAVNYAKQGPERIRFMLAHIHGLEKEFRQGLFSGRVSMQEINALLQILQTYEAAMLHHRPVILHISLASPALLEVLRLNGANAFAEMIVNYAAYKQTVLHQLNAVRTGNNNPNLAVPEATLAGMLKNFDPVQNFFHNRPLKGTIPWASIAKAEFEPFSEMARQRGFM